MGMVLLIVLGLFLGLLTSLRVISTVGSILGLGLALFLGDML